VVNGTAIRSLSSCSSGESPGSLAAKDCTVTYRQSGRKLAVLSIGRDCDSLAAEIELEKTIAAGS
jgi:hypothetical protein